MPSHNNQNRAIEPYPWKTNRHDEFFNRHRPSQAMLASLISLSFCFKKPIKIMPFHGKEMSNNDKTTILQKLLSCH
jgi:hypothetical protein